MNYVRLSPDEQRVVCEDLLAIEEAGLLPRLAALRQRLLREHRPASHGEQVAIDHLSKQAASLIGGSRGYWREAAAAALGVSSRVDVCVEAVCMVAEDVRWQEPDVAEPQRPAPRVRMTIGSRKRGGR